MNPWDEWADSVKIGSLVRVDNPPVLARVIGGHGRYQWFTLLVLDGRGKSLVRPLGDLSPPAPLELLADAAK